MFAATLSSALGSFLGAPRILQAMGQDRLLKPLIFFGKGHGPNNEPRRATVLSMFIAIAIVWAGGLNAVARVISMFFLIAYGMINLSAFVEGRGGNPSFRPRFKLFGWPAGLAGSIGCAIAMLKIDETYALISMAIAGALYFSLRGRAESEWGDAKRGYIFSRTRKNLLLLEKSAADPKNWRPAMAVLTDDIERDRQMITCASWLESRRGILSVLEITDHPGSTRERLDVRRERVRLVRELLREKEIVGFSDAVVVPRAGESLDAVLQSYSIGSLRPNTLMVAIPPAAERKRREELVAMMKTLAAFDANVVLYKGGELRGPVRERIDLWWHGQQNGSLMALFAYLTTTHAGWNKVRTRLLRVVFSEDERQEAERNLRELTEAARMVMDVEVVLSTRSISELIIEHSSDADLVLLGLAEADLLDFQRFLDSRSELLELLPPTLFIRSNGQVDLLA